MKKQVMKELIILINILFMLFNLTNQAFSYDKNDLKHILVINSYNHGVRWTSEEANGIVETLKKKDNLLISVEYMDWKNYPTQDNIDQLNSYFRYKYEGRKIDLLITTDDAALKYALENRKEMFSSAPVIFCGVNEKGIDEITAGYHDFTGVMENVDPTESLKLALSFHPSLQNVYVLSDNSESGLSSGTLVDEKVRSMNRNLNVIHLNNLNLDQLIDRLKQIEKNSIIFITAYYSDADGTAIDSEEITRIVSRNSVVPVYHMNDSGLNNGAIGGEMLDGKLQGKTAADIAVRVLNGEDINSIPVDTKKTNLKALDYNALEKFQIPISKIPAGYQVVNKPFSFFETYKLLIISVLTVFTILVASLLVLLVYIRNIHKLKNELYESNEELSRLYEELAASDEELKQQFDELSSYQEKLSKSEERYRIAYYGSNAVIWDFDLIEMTYQFSEKFYELLGYEEGELDEAHGGWKQIIHEEDAREAEQARQDHLDGRTTYYNAEYRMRTKAGDYVWFNVRGKALQNVEGRNIRFAGSMIDVTERKLYEKKLQESYDEIEATYEELAANEDERRHQYEEILASREKIRQDEEKFTYMAYHDELTGLKNKLSLFEISNRDIFTSNAQTIGLLFLDIDNFKYINDTMGHAFGDKLIAKVSHRLASLLVDGCSLYRLSGDEFIIILQNIRDRDDARLFASNVMAGFKEQFCIDGSVLHISLSIGIVFYPEQAGNIEELLKYADIAMYKAKEEGRDRVAIYNQAMNETITERVNIEKYLHTALLKNEFELYYQPQLHIESNKIAGFEALLRWKSPELGFIPPLKFIKVAEDTHIIIQLGSWVLRKACELLKKLHLSGYPDLVISVNISIIQLIQNDFNDIVMDTLEFLDLEPEYLELEITESVLIQSYDSIRNKLNELKAKGVRIALDDFGKGFSSLSYLKQLPISTLKIDKSFIDDITSEYGSDSLTGQIIEIGKCMGMNIVAEGVEDSDQFNYLKNFGCDLIQGYLFSRPVPESDVRKLLENH